MLDILLGVGEMCGHGNCQLSSNIVKAGVQSQDVGMRLSQLNAHITNVRMRLSQLNAHITNVGMRLSQLNAHITNVGMRLSQLNARIIKRWLYDVTISVCSFKY